MVPDQRPRSITIKHNIFIFNYYYLCIHAQLKSRRFRNRPGGTKNGTRKNGASGPGMIPEKLQRGRGEKTGGNMHREKTREAIPVKIRGKKKRRQRISGSREEPRAKYPRRQQQKNGAGKNAGQNAPKRRREHPQD